MPMVIKETLIPQNDYILAEPVKEEELKKSKSGLFLPAMSGESPLTKHTGLMRAVAVSEGVWTEAVGSDGQLLRKPMPVREGDLFYFAGKVPGVIVNGEHYGLVQAYQVCAVMHREEVEETDVEPVHIELVNG